MRLVVSTCGTSLLTQEAPNDLRRILHGIANRKRDEIPEEVRTKVDAHIEARRTRLLAAEANEVRALSAELNGILALYGGRIPDTVRSDLHILLVTDTSLGQASADAVAAWLRQHQVPVQGPHVIRDLVTDSLETFRFGVQELVHWCEKWLPGYRPQYRIIFNLTGGFKAVQGIMNTLAHEYADETVYIFERSQQLLRIPALPFTWDPIGLCRAHFTPLRQLAIDARPAGEVRGLPEVLVLEEDGMVSLSLVGEIVWTKGSVVLYRERLHAPPSDRIRYTTRFERDARAMTDPDRIKQINERIDDLERHLRRVPSKPGASSQVKPVVGKPSSVPPQVTHECYAWSDGAAYRIFFHYEKDGIVLDALGPHL